MGNNNGRQLQGRGGDDRQRNKGSDMSCFEIIISGLFRRRPGDGYSDEYYTSHDEAAARRMRRSRLSKDDDDHLLCYSVSEPGIDWKADALIKRFHDSQSS